MLCQSISCSEVPILYWGDLRTIPCTADLVVLSERVNECISGAFRQCRFCLRGKAENGNGIQPWILLEVYQMLTNMRL